MDVIAGPRVDILILLNGRAFSIIFAARADSTVENAETNTHAPVHQKFNKGVVHVEHHGGNQLIANSFEEGTVEVAVLAPSEHQSDRLLGKISIYEHQNECSIEELTQECDSCNTFKLCGLSRVSNPYNNHDNDGSKDIIEANQNVRETGT